MKFFNQNLFTMPGIIVMLISGLFGYQPDYGPGSSWNVVQSTSQSFIIFDEITVFGNASAGGVNDGSPTGVCPDENCDIVAIIYNNVVIGWSYCTIAEGEITISINLNDFVTNGVENYPNPGALINISLYDASEGLVYFGVTTELGPVYPLSLIQAGGLNVEGDGPTAADPAGCPSVYADNFDPNAGSGDMDLCEFPEITGCTDSDACNYNDPENAACVAMSDVCVDDGSCAEEDCNQVCGGTSFIDDCNICADGDTGLDPNDDKDCNGDCFGSAVLDDCDVCAGGETGLVPNEDKDCNEDCFGSAELDDCGVCAGGNTGLYPNDDKDCNGDCVEGTPNWDGELGGTAAEDACGVCSLGNTGLEPNVADSTTGFVTGPDADCAGDCMEGTPEWDELYGGTAVIDDCGVCAGGNTGLYPNDDKDCNGDCMEGTPNWDGELGGTAIEDVCGVCSLGNTGLVPNEADSTGFVTGPDADCAGDCMEGTPEWDGNLGGTAVIDDCGICSDGNSEHTFNAEMDCSGECAPDTPNPCIGDDCGISIIDNCGTCIEPFNADGTPNEGCSCFDWQSDCTGLCPDHDNYGSNFPDSLSYNTSGNEISELLTYFNDLALTIVTVEDTLAFEELLLDSLTELGMSEADLETGYDCAGECGGVSLFDASDPAECCAGEDIDCAGFCYGTLYADVNGICCDPDELGCDNVCSSENSFDACGDCNNAPGDSDYTAGTCYTFDGNATNESCSQIDPIGDTCTIGQCFADGVDADSCGLCGGNDLCVSDINVESSTSSLQIDVSWSELENNSSNVYYIYRNEDLIDSIATTSYTDFNLNYGEEYCYNIAASSSSYEYYDMVYKFSQCVSSLAIPDLEFSMPPLIISPANLQVTIPIYLTTITPDLPINQISMTLQYDDEVLNITDYTAVNTVAAEGFDLDGGVSNNQIQLSLQSSGEGVVIGAEAGYQEAILEISGTAGSGYDGISTEITFNNVYANGAEYSFVTFNSMFEIVNYTFTIDGDVDYYSNNLPTPNTMIELDGFTNLWQAHTDTAETNDNGFFTFESVPPGDEFTFTAMKDNSNLGVELSASDASKIARNSVGLEELSDLELVAADVTLNGEISGLDASRVARYSINAISALNTQNLHWTFYPDMIDIGEIMGVAIGLGIDEIRPECIETNITGQFICRNGALAGDECDPENPVCPFFQSIRLGDVTGNWVPVPDLARTEPTERDPVEMVVSPGDEIILPIHLVETDVISGINVSIQFDPQFLSLENVELTGQSLIENGYELLTNVQDNTMHFAVYGPMNLAPAVQLVNVAFTVLDVQSGNSEILLSSISVNETISESGFYFVNDEGNETLTNEIIVHINELDISDSAIPESYHLYQNSPNPFNPVTEITFDLPEKNKVRLEIYDITGNRVKILLDNKSFNAGKHVTVWNAESYSAGIYFYRLTAGHYSSIQKMILLK